MLSISVSRSQRLAFARPARPATRVSRQLVVRSAKKSKDDELDEAYMEQLAYLERRRERLISPRVPKKRGSSQAAQDAAPVVQTTPPKKAKAEPSIQIEQDEPKKGGGNPFGFLSNLFGKK